MVERINYRPEIAALRSEDFMSDPLLEVWKLEGIEGVLDGMGFISTFIDYLRNPYFFLLYQNPDEVLLLRQFVEVLCHEGMQVEKRIWDEVMRKHVGCGVDALRTHFPDVPRAQSEFER